MTALTFSAEASERRRTTIAAVMPERENAMVDIALDPNMYYPTHSGPQVLYKAAELGFKHVELSPFAQFHFWHHYPKADDAFVAQMKQASRDTGVNIRTRYLTGPAWMKPNVRPRYATGSVCWN